MKHLYTYLFLFFGICFAFSQKPVTDQLSTNNGPLIIRPICHGALVLSWNNKTIYVDPYSGAKAYAGIPDPNLILITDIHQDHMDTATLNHINTAKATVVMPQAVSDLIGSQLLGKAKILKNDEHTTQHGISISAVPMYNLREEAKNMHVKGRGNGYLLNLGGKTIYISGDTEDIPEMRALKNIDLAFVCMNLPYTMDIKQAASAVLEFKPVVIYPYHYRGKDGFSDTKEFKKLVNTGNKSIDVRLRDWYANK